MKNVLDRQAPAETDYFPSIELTQGKPQEKTYKGLCVNCDHREYCQYSCSETGIWYCEEYK